MAKVFLTTTGDNKIRPTSYDDFFRVEESARFNSSGEHCLIDDPEKADIILFVGATESDFWDVRHHHLRLTYPEKTFLYHSEDIIFPFIPGIYPSLLKKNNLFDRSLSGGYTSILHIDIPVSDFNPNSPYKFSFCGSFKTHPVRNHLQQLIDHPQGLIIDTSQELSTHQGGAHSPGKHRDRYAQILKDSQFVLCPRGRGPCSWRLYETMKAQRIPVIIADDWLEPNIPENWSTFSLRVREKDIYKIPELIEQHSSEANSMAQKARQVYELYFSRERFFYYLVEQCLTLKTQRKIPERYACYLSLMPLIYPKNVRYFVLPRLKKLLLSR